MGVLWNEMAGATCAGCASTLIGHPLDTIKVHLQTQPKLTNTYHAAHSLIQAGGGPSVFLRGIGPPLCNAVIMNTAMFLVFRSVKNAVSSDSVSDSFTGLGPTGSALFAGVVSGLVTACISTPSDFVKIQSQLRGTPSATVLTNTMRNHPSALFRGHLPNLGREGIFTMVYLGLYDVLKGDTTPPMSPGAGLGWVALVSSLTGGMAWFVSYPCDTIKTIMQASGGKHKQPLSLKNAISEVKSRGGYSAFYRGCGASTGRAMLVTSTRMIAYEYVLGFYSLRTEPI